MRYETADVTSSGASEWSLGPSWAEMKDKVSIRRQDEVHSPSSFQVIESSRSKSEVGALAGGYTERIAVRRWKVKGIERKDRRYS